MDCVRCTCGCDKLSQEELQAILNSCDRTRDFLRNDKARKMFFVMFSPEQPVSGEPQPSGSQNRPVGKRPIPKAIKFMEFIEEAEILLQANLSEEDVLQFVERIENYFPIQQVDDMKLQLKGSSYEKRVEVLELIIEQFVRQVIESKQFKMFQTKLVEAYKGKIKIEKQ